MKANIEHKGKVGIYCIRNIVNQKVYVGKSKCIYRRIVSHISALKNNVKKSENQYFINAWNKYGSENFDYYILELVDLEKISERELHWVKELDSTNSDKGYNLRIDSSSCMIVHEKTKKKLSNHMKKQHADGSRGEKTSKFFKKYWKENPDVKERMSKKVSKSKEKYRFLQYDKQMNLIKIWNTVKDIVEENPTFKWQQIYAVCNGYKPSIYGFIWRKEIKI